MKIKNIILAFFMLLFFHVNASEFSEIMSKATEFKLAGNYSKAIRFYNKAIKFERYNDAIVKDIYFQIADCYYKAGREVIAYKVLKATVYKLGATKLDFQSNSIVDKDFLKASWEKLEPKYNTYRKRYIASLEGVDEYLANGNYVLNPKK